jgi:hypothetical protein
MGCACSAITATSLEGVACSPGLLMRGCWTRVSTLSGSVPGSEGEEEPLASRPPWGRRGERLMVGQDVKLPPLKQVPEMTNPGKNGSQFSIEGRVTLLHR